MQQVQEEYRENIVQINHAFYERMWAQSKFYGPENFNTWDVLSELCRKAPRRLEIGPGLRPRLPIQGTVFLDLSEVACERLNAMGGNAHVGSIESLTLAEKSFDLICLFDVIEHIPNDQAVFHQLSQLLVDEGILFFSVPLHAHAWTGFDALVGHYRRYDPDDLKALVDRCGFDIRRSVAFGMQPKSTLLNKLSTWSLTRHFEVAMSFHNRFLFPLGLKMQRTLRFKEGLTCDPDIDEVLIICQRRPRESFRTQ